MSNIDVGSACARRAWALTIFLVGCGALPPATARPGELAVLQRRVEASPSDVDSTLRLAGGLWASDDRQSALEVLRAGAAVRPDAGAVLAALGTAEEGAGNYMDARDAYLRALPRLDGSDLSRSLVRRLSDIRAEVAGPLAREIIDSSRPFGGPEREPLVAAVLPLSSVGDDADTDAIAAGLTELMVQDARTLGPFAVVDRELMTALVDEVGTPPPGAQGRAVAEEVAWLVGASRVVWGEVTTIGTGPLSVQAYVLSVGSLGVRIDGLTVEAATPANPALRRELARSLWELMVGAVADDPVLLESIASLPELPREALVPFGRGVVSADRGDHAEAASNFEVAGGVAPDFVTSNEAAQRERRLISVRESRLLYLIDDAVAVARRQRVLGRLIDDGTPAPVPRLGSVSEIFGLDRLGAHALVDFVVRIGGGL